MQSSLSLKASANEIMWCTTLPLLASRARRRKQDHNGGSAERHHEAKGPPPAPRSLSHNKRTTKRVRRVLSVEGLEATGSCEGPASVSSVVEATHTPIISPRFIRAATAQQQQPLASPSMLHYLREHLNEFTGNIDISTSHRFKVLEHIASPMPRQSTQQPQQQRCRMLLLEPAVYAKTELLFQKLLVGSIASLVFPSALQPEESSSSLSDSASSTSCAESSLRTTQAPRVVQVHNTVREFIMNCNTCAAHGFDHRFVVNGTIGDIHIVTPPAAPQNTPPRGMHKAGGNMRGNQSAAADDAKSEYHSITSSQSKEVSQSSSPLLPSDTAVILEVKNSHALNQKMLSQALLELELQKHLVCCQGRTYGPHDDHLSPAALLKRPVTNCTCTEAADTVLILWGSESCVITSANRITGERNVEKEDQIVTWVRAAHARLAERAGAQSLSRSGASKSRNSTDFLDPPEVDPYNIISHVRPLPHVNWNMRCTDGLTLGFVSFEVLALHPSITLPFDEGFSSEKRVSTSSERTSGIHTPAAAAATVAQTALATSAPEADNDDVSTSTSTDSNIADEPELPLETLVVESDATTVALEQNSAVRTRPRPTGKRHLSSSAMKPFPGSTTAVAGRRSRGGFAQLTTERESQHHEITLISAADAMRTSKRRCSSVGVFPVAPQCIPQADRISQRGGSWHLQQNNFYFTRVGLGKVRCRVIATVMPPLSPIVFQRRWWLLWSLLV
jgi:hypothetical protein